MLSPGSSNQQSEEIRLVNEELSSTKIALRGSENSFRILSEDKNRLELKYEKLEKEYQRTVEELRETLQKLQDKEEDERQLNKSLNEQKQLVSQLRIYERTVNLYLKPGLELVSKFEKSLTSSNGIISSTSNINSKKGIGKTNATKLTVVGNKKVSKKGKPTKKNKERR